MDESRKLDNGENVICSFGTIGETFEERVQLCEAMEEHEVKGEGRIQDRAIVELPHEANPPLMAHFPRS